MSEVDLGALYRAARERVTALVADPAVDPGLPVPATPRWRVRDVVAHVTGVAHDAATGNMAGAPGDEWTAAQVDRSADRTIAEMIEQWEADAIGVEAFFSSPAGAAMGAGVYDVHCHEADLRNALGLPFQMPGEFLGWAADGMRGGFHEAVAAEGLAPVDLQIPDAEWYRGRLGRRTEAEVRAYPWPVDPTPYLDVFFVFGRAEQSLGERA
jgi:uncharacterized protein (TIGR03083 family)